MLMHFEVHFSMNRQLELIYTRNPFDFKTHFSKILSKFRMAIWSTLIYTIGQTLVRYNYKARFSSGRDCDWSQLIAIDQLIAKGLLLFETMLFTRIRQYIHVWLELYQVFDLYPDCWKGQILANTFFGTFDQTFDHTHMDQVKLTQKRVWARFVEIQFISSKK